MKPNKFSKLTQQSLTLTAQIVLIVIAVATIFAIAQEIGHVWEAGSIAVGDLLMLFLYLEVISMLNHYLGSGNLPVRYPLYIGIIAGIEANNFSLFLVNLTTSSNDFD